MGEGDVVEGSFDPEGSKGEGVGGNPVCVPPKRMEGDEEGVLEVEGEDERRLF